MVPRGPTHDHCRSKHPEKFQESYVPREPLVTLAQIGRTETRCARCRAKHETLFLLCELEVCGCCAAYLRDRGLRA